MVDLNESRPALMTGTTGGIGRTITRCLPRRGYPLMLGCEAGIVGGAGRAEALAETCSAFGRQQYIRR